MRSTLNDLKRFAAAAVALLFVSTAMFADGESSEVYLTGASNSVAGDYVVTASDDVYHFQGQDYAVYHVYYDNPMHNMKIAVSNSDNCDSFIRPPS